MSHEKLNKEQGSITIFFFFFFLAMPYLCIFSWQELRSILLHSEHHSGEWCSGSYLITGSRCAATTSSHPSACRSMLCASAHIVAQRGRKPWRFWTSSSETVVVLSQIAFFLLGREKEWNNWNMRLCPVTWILCTSASQVRLFPLPAFVFWTRSWLEVFWTIESSFTALSQLRRPPTAIPPPLTEVYPAAHTVSHSIALAELYSSVSIRRSLIMKRKVSCKIDDGATSPVCCKVFFRWAVITLLSTGGKQMRGLQKKK